MTADLCKRASWGLCIPLLLMSGCGYIGEPLPPLLNIPGKGSNLAAVERGANLIIHVSLPTLTTEGVAIKRTVHLDLRIGVKSGGSTNPQDWAPQAKAIGGAAIANGVAEYHVPAAEWVGKQVLIAAKVIGANGRDSGWSDPIELTVIAPLEQPRELTAEAVPQGVRLTWQAAGGTFAILRRGPDEDAFREIGRATKTEYIDSSIVFGKSYRYLVQTVAKAGTGEAQSELSKEIDITPLDTFAASAPTGLTAVPSTSSVELAWERNPEPTVTGYRVYRATGDGPFQPIGDLQTLPTYSDRTAEPGKKYRYAVTAVKSNKVESKMSAVVEAGI